MLISFIERDVQSSSSKLESDTASLVAREVAPVMWDWESGGERGRRGEEGDRRQHTGPLTRSHRRALAATCYSWTARADASRHVCI